METYNILTIVLLIVSAYLWVKSSINADKFSTLKNRLDRRKAAEYSAAYGGAPVTKVQLVEKIKSLSYQLAEEKAAHRKTKTEYYIQVSRTSSASKEVLNLREDLETANKRNALQADKIETLEKQVKGLEYRNSNQSKKLTITRETIQELRDEKQEIIRAYEDYIKGLADGITIKTMNVRTDLINKTQEPESVKDFHEPLFETGELESLIDEDPPKPKKKSTDCEWCTGTGEAANGIDDCPICCGTGQANPLKTNCGYSESQPDTLPASKYSIWWNGLSENDREELIELNPGCDVLDDLHIKIIYEKHSHSWKPESPDNEVL